MLQVSFSVLLQNVPNPDFSHAEVVKPALFQRT